MGVVGNKRGNLTEMVLSPMFIVVITLALVFLPLLKYATSIGQSSYFEREFYSKDLGLMISALQASPNDVVLSYDNVKTVNITFKANYVEAYAYDVDPLKSPSKVSRFHIFPSSLNIVEVMLSPALLIDEKGNVNPIPYNIMINKDSKTITASLSNGYAFNPVKKDSIDIAIDGFISHLYAEKNIYIDVVYGTGLTSDNIEGDAFGKRICTGATIGSSISKIEKCNLENRATLDERIKLAKSAEFVIVIFVNEDSNDDLKIYYYEGIGESVYNSKKIAEYAVKLFTIGEYSLEKDEISHLDNDEIKKILTKEKAGFVIELGNIEERKKNDIDIFSNALKNLIDGVSK